MFPVLFADVWQYVFGILMSFTALFVILLVLVQRGRGGGLAGALGGMGGQSAFGAKAGDTFTKITIVAASFWIILCVAGVWSFGKKSSKLDITGNNEATSASEPLNNGTEPGPAPEPDSTEPDASP